MSGLNRRQRMGLRLQSTPVTVVCTKTYLLCLTSAKVAAPRKLVYTDRHLSLENTCIIRQD
ncbi:hypothetical protein AUEXF2481DRAFT_615199 [Aureobasidium subglaciale EXF-2481]|uniref:Uncharacterized protein n=1 Tax=Aureobasidium subglaciale (strain EXF-2481) TaxID=1043005 RepID=A0A074ZDT0_AURSE|nr:uncharacterized protein AUEXF2481DRAFT_615199 [Aureobasidium subglaciale EXF-2481]KEQ96831.1 hypothetical protein AUEXF2481DRAFT_615199 [Aureobasidium subglaciale EXF-2481]